MRISLAVAFIMIGVSSAALADDPTQLNLRVGKLESEMHAVQRKVFPDGNPIEPDIATSKPSVPAGTAASSPINDLTQRVDLLEAQVKTLTGQVEQNGVRLRRLEESSRAYDTRIKALEPHPDAATGDNSVSPPPVGPAKTLKSTKPAATTKTTAVATKVGADKKRDALVAAVPVPDTGDATEDSYTYGYRLFAAKLYPEAEVKLTEFVGKYPKAKRYTFAQNLLGRAYFEEGKYANAAKAFVMNYTSMPKGERAPESLSWAGVALMRDNLPTKACRVYQEFDDVYGANAPREARDRVAQGRIDAKCTK